jgi:Homoserine trans-succinylase
VLEHPELRILAENEETGPALISTENGRQIFMDPPLCLDFPPLTYGYPFFGRRPLEERG